eukprot:CAMPEP_0115352738 /NCGR_PEP_ID=MMETSP0270-20121206/97665_1 /TAXON_ID=71861 /ORGANISM="Scrippsiella trochoidea, Strain CCMP3099" /LENGTH=48 /DNA_ID= /DNA_START= /DNA_END= /DNA_ORIENTATION=
MKRGIFSQMYVATARGAMAFAARLCCNMAEPCMMSSTAASHVGDASSQ